MIQLGRPRNERIVWKRGGEEQWKAMISDDVGDKIQSETVRQEGGDGGLGGGGGLGEGGSQLEFSSADPAASGGLGEGGGGGLGEGASSLSAGGEE